MAVAGELFRSAGEYAVAVDQLYHPDEQHLPLDDAICRIATAFRWVILDRVRGDAGVREKYESLLTLGAPDVILQSHLSQVGVTVWVSVADDDVPEGRVEFVLAPYQDVFVQYRSLADRERLRPIVAKLAKLLGYQVTARE